MSEPAPTATNGRPSDADNMRQQVRFHMERAERFRIRAEKAEAELKRRDDGDAW